MDGSHQLRSFFLLPQPLCLPVDAASAAPPEAPTRLTTQLSLLSSLDEVPSNGDLLRQLSSMRLQLKHEKDRVEHQLARNQEHKVVGTLAEKT